MAAVLELYYLVARTASWDEHGWLGMAAHMVTRLTRKTPVLAQTLLLLHPRVSTSSRIYHYHSTVGI